LCNYSIRGHVS